VKRLSLLGIRVDSVTREEIKQISLRLIAEKKPSLFVSLGTLTLMLARKDPAYRQLLEEAELVICDGAGVVSGLKYLTGEKITRQTGVDLVPFFAELAAEKGLKLFLLGAEQEVIEKAAAVLKRELPGVNICGFLNGYFDIINSSEIIDKIKKVSPDILLVGLGQPAQEKWLKANLNALAVPVTMGVGGSFDVIAGKIPRAPVFFRKTGLEWFFRMVLEPRRFKRNLVLLKFVFLIIKNKVTGGNK